MKCTTLDRVLMCFLFLLNEFKMLMLKFIALYYVTTLLRSSVSNANIVSNYNSVLLYHYDIRTNVSIYDYPLIVCKTSYEINKKTTIS